MITSDPANEAAVLGQAVLVKPPSDMLIVGDHVTMTLLHQRKEGHDTGLFTARRVLRNIQDGVKNGIALRHMDKAIETVKQPKVGRSSFTANYRCDRRRPRLAASCQSFEGSIAPHAPYSTALDSRSRVLTV